MGGPDGGPATFMDTIVLGGGLAQVAADHLGLDIHVDEGLAVVEAHHLGLDVAVPHTCIDHLWLLCGQYLLVGSVQALQRSAAATATAAVSAPRGMWPAAGLGVCCSR